jgi:dipeptidase D
MGGAHGLAADVLQGRLMLNLDTEDWGEFYLGCAGGLDVNVSRSGAGEPVPGGFEAWQIGLAGLRGGHSGVDIHEERGNAIKLLVRVLRALEATLPLRLAGLVGAPRATPCPAKPAPPCLPAGHGPALAAALDRWQALLRSELAGVDAGITLSVAPGTTEAVLAAGEQAVWLASLHAAPHGVRRRSLAVPGVVETSNNLGMVDLGPAAGTATSWCARWWTAAARPSPTRSPACLR